MAQLAGVLCVTEAGSLTKELNLHVLVSHALNLDLKSEKKVIENLHRADVDSILQVE